jgi:peroxiredoxin
MATTATQVTLDTPAAEFRLPATDGKTYTMEDVAGKKGTVVVLSCPQGAIYVRQSYS